MPRTRKVSREDAVQAAKLAFWRYGYGLGVRKLEEATGVNRFMLQTDFGGKEGLFLEALDAYLDRADETTFTPMSKGSLEDIINLFMGRTEDAGSEEAHCGCLAVSTVADLDANSDEILRRKNRFFSMINKGFRGALIQELKSGHLREDIEIKDAVTFLTSSLIGINTFIKAKGRNSLARPSAKIICDVIRSWEK